MPAHAGSNPLGDNASMGYDEAVEVLRGWESAAVVVELEPEGTVMEGRLTELDAAGIDGALFALSRDAPGLRDTTGVAIALFRDGVSRTELQAGTLVVHQGRMTVSVRLADAATCGGRRSGRD
jgi:hypothetical protein